MNRPDLTDVELYICESCSEMVKFRNSYYDKIQEIYESPFAQNFLLKNILIFDTAQETAKEAQRNLKSVHDYHFNNHIGMTLPQKEILSMTERWWKIFIQEIEQNKLIASRYIAKQQTKAPYSFFSQFADRKHGQKLNKESNQILKDIAAAIDKYIL